MRSAPISRIREDSTVGTSFAWAPNTMLARLVSVIDVARVAMSWTCQERSRMERMTVRS